MVMLAADGRYVSRCVCVCVCACVRACVCVWCVFACACAVACTSIIFFMCLTLSRATEQYCAAGAILKPLCLSKLLTLCSQQHIDQLFPGHIV